MEYALFKAAFTSAGRSFGARRACRILASCALATAVVTPAAAQTTYSVAGGGLWTGSATWSPNVVGGPLATDVIAIVNPAPASTVSLGGTAGSVYNIASITHSGSSAIIFSPSTVASNTGAKTLAVAGDVRVNGSGRLTFRQSGSPNLLTLTVGGNLLVDSGTLAIGTDVNNPSPTTFTLSGSTVVASGATLASANFGANTAFNRTVLNGAFTYYNHATTNSRAATFAGLSGTGSISTIDAGVSTFTVSLSNTTSSFTYAGSITQSGTNTTVAIQKTNAGRQILSGALTYSGATTISGGVLQFDSAMPAATRVVFDSTSGTSVLGLGFGNLVMNTGQSAGQVHWNNNAVGGFAAYTADRTVTLNGGAGLTWATNSFMAPGPAVNSPNSQLVLGSDTADAKVAFVNNVDFSGGTRTILVPNGPARFEGELSGVLSNGGIRKQGAGVLLLTGSAATGFTLQVTAGVAAIAGTGTYGGNFFLDGGVLGLGNGGLTRAIGTGDGQVRLTADGAGFAAFDSDRTVNIGGGANLTWATTTNFFSAGGSRMVLNVAQSEHKLTFANNLDLNGTRTIEAGDGSAAIDATLTGVVSGATSSLVKAGAGTLELAGANTFGNATTVREGVVRFSTLAAGAAAQNLGQGALVNLGVAATSAGEIDYRGLGGTLDKNITALGTGRNRIRNSGGGTLALSGTLTKDGTILELASGTFTVTGRIMGASENSDLFVNGANVTLTNTNNDYNGPTYIYGVGTVTLGASNVIPNGSALTLGGSGGDTGSGAIVTGTFTDTVASLATSSLGGTVGITINGAAGGGLTTTGNLTFGAGTDALNLSLAGLTLGKYSLLTYQGTRSGTFDTVNITNPDSRYTLVYGGASNSAIELQMKANQATSFMLTPAAARVLVGGSTTLSGGLANSSPTGAASLAWNPAVTGSLTGVASSLGSSIAAGGTSTITATFLAGNTAGSQNWSLVNTDNNAIETTSTASGSIDVVNQRTFSVSNSGTINLGNFLRTAAVTGSATISSTGSNATTANAALGAFSGTSTNGLSLGLGSGTNVFNGGSALQQAVYTLSGSATSAGAINGSFTSLVTAELGSIDPVSVALVGTAYDPAKASFASGLTTTSLTVDIGEFNQNTGNHTKGFSIFNLLTDQFYTADLMLVSITDLVTQSSSLSIDLTPGLFGTLQAGGTSNWLATLTSGSTGSFSNQYQLNFESAKNSQSLGGPQSMTLTVTGIIVVPEPGALALAGIGIAAAALGIRRRSR